MYDAIFGGGGNGTTTFNGLDCTNCTFNHNLFTNTTNAIGTNNIIGSPTFVGGFNPITWAGYQLTSSSIGYQQAIDSTKDIGSNYFGSVSNSVVPILLAPSHLRLL